MSRVEKIIPVRRLNPIHADDDLWLQIDVRLSVEDGPQSQPTSPGKKSDPSRADLLRFAFAIYEARRKRDRILGGDLFGEPAWDMLLALYCLPTRGERLSVTALNYAANVAQSTGLRVQTLLAERGWIERRREKDDRRRQIVALTETARSMIENYLLGLVF